MHRSFAQITAVAATFLGGVRAVALPQTTYPATSEMSTSVGSLSFSDAGSLVKTTWNGQKYGCKCYIGQSCWPSASKWNSLNSTVGGSLIVDIPPGAPCHNTFDGPLGTVNTYNAAACAEATAMWTDETWHVNKPASELWTYGTNDTCRPTTNPADPCTLGFFPIYVIMATTKQHIKAGIDFARKNNIRVIVRNTGHDFLNRSTGWGSLVINTHSFQDVSWISSYSGPGGYTGTAAKLGAGVQGKSILTQGNARNPPLAIVTGECPTVGVSGGYVQGGGHGPWTTLKGFAADNVLEFEAITASGEYVTVNAGCNADLFWALKGGGPASFAVILSVTVKSFPDIQSAGATLFINATHTTDPDTFWEGVKIFHKWSNHFVDSGLYVYFEIFPETFRILPFVGIGKTTAQLQTILQPFLDELEASNIPHEFAIKQFSTFYNLYVDLFEAEAAGGSAITGGWMFNHEDVAVRNTEIVDAFKTVIFPRSDLIGIIVGHLFNPGFGMPVSNSATNPAWRNASDFIIAVLPVPDGASLATKADLQNVLTNTMDGALMGASESGCTYVNEADPYQNNWQSHFWGSSYPRLKQLRKKWDPLGIFYAISTPGTEDWAVIQDGTKLCKKL